MPVNSAWPAFEERTAQGRFSPSTYAIALDGEKRPCAVRSSNAGHALFTGIAYPERASASPFSRSESAWSPISAASFAAPFLAA
jgi:hypothetical protein